MRSPNTERRSGLVLVILLSSLLATHTAAQDQGADAIPAQALNPESFYGRDATRGVYVRDSAVALEKFALAQRMERLKEWAKSADVYQEILEKFPDRVVPSQIDANNNIYQYTSVVTAVQEKLSRWPQEGLQVYRARYETPAATLLQQARGEDAAALHQVCRLYFPTETAKAAAIRLIDLYLEQGEFAAAAWLGDRLLNWHPTVVVERPMVLFRTAISYHLSSDADAAAARLDELKAKYPDATGTVRGRDVALAEALQQELAAAPPVALYSAAESWPTFGGSPDRGRVPALGAATPGAKLFSIELPRPNWRSRGLNPQDLRNLQVQDERDRQAGLTLGIMPAIDRNELFFQDGAAVYAVSLESGLPLPGWKQTHGGRSGTYSIGGWSSPRNTQLTLTVTDDSVFAVMGQSDRLAMMANLVPPADRETRLVCLDRATGQERWITSPRRLPQDANALRNLELSGSPLILGDNVYVIARGGKGVQFEDCYILCFDRHNGTFRWSCYVASANTAQQMWGDVGAVSDTVSHLAYASGRLYVLTNLGAVAAIDAYSGTILWLNIYPREAVDEMNQAMGMPQRRWGRENPSPVRPWAFNPVIVRDGKVFALPSDARHLLIYDAGTGAEVKRVKRADLFSADTILGVLGDTLLVAGEKRVVCFNWSLYSSERFNTSDRNIIPWWKDFSSPIRGRGFVTADSVYLTTAGGTSGVDSGLYRVAIKTGKVEAKYPRDRGWDESEGPGNVVATADHVIIAGAQRIDVYTDLQVAQAKLEREVAAAPTEPAPRLRYAEIMFVAGRFDLAAQKLDEAIELLGGVRSMRPGPERDRVFNDALAFAQQLGREDRPEAIVLARRLFDRAAASASAPPQRVDYRLARAVFAHRVRDFDSVVQLYQEILSETALRTVVRSGEDGVPAQAGAIAEHAIAELIVKAGRGCYAMFDRAAEQALTDARVAQDPAALLAVAQGYPNATVAADAMLAAADAYEAAADHRLATQVLRQIYFKYPASPHRPRVLEALARNYLVMPNRIEVAISRLATGAKLFPDTPLANPLKLPDGRTLSGVTFAEALEQVRQQRGQSVVAALPDLHLPPPLSDEEKKAGKRQPKPFLPAEKSVTVGDVDAIVPALRPFARHDRVVTWSGAMGISIHEVGQVTPVARTQAVQDVPKAVAWVGGNLLTWSGTEVAVLPADSGNPTWRVELEALGPLEALGEESPPTDSEAQVQVDEINDAVPNLLLDEQLMRMHRRNRLLRMRAEAVMPAAPPAAGPEQIADVLPVGDRVIATTNSGRVFSLDMRDGTVAWQARLSNRPIDRLLGSEDFTVVRVVDEFAVQIVVLDTFGGQVLSRRSFNAAGGMVPVNMALAADGTLVYTLPDRICGKDLYEPDSRLTFEVQVPSQGNPVFLGAVQPDQLLVADGRILAVSDNGQFVCVHSLEDGRPLRYVSPEAGKEFDARLKTGASNWNVSMRLVGPFLYVFSPRALFGYNLDRAGQSWSKEMDKLSVWNIRDVFVGKDYLILLDETTDRKVGGHVAPAYRANAFSRLLLPDRDNRESGLWVYSPEISDPAGIANWQAVDGGLCYLSGDRKLHFLRGSRETK